VNENPTQIVALVDGMREAIQTFERGQLRIDRLAWELKSRIALLRDVSDKAWADELKAIWNQLEVINAFFIESGRDSLTDEERKELDAVLDEMGAALVSY
jgi:hypothetical protein